MSNRLTEGELREALDFVEDHSLQRIPKNIAQRRRAACETAEGEPGSC